MREVVWLVCERLGQRFENATRVVNERPGQDAAYVIDSTKARTELGWQPEVDFAELIAEMIAAEQLRFNDTTEEGTSLDVPKG